MAPLKASLKKLDIEELVTDVLVKFGSGVSETCHNALHCIHTLCHVSPHYTNYYYFAGSIRTVAEALNAQCPRVLHESAEGVWEMGLIVLNSVVGNGGTFGERLKEFAAAGGVHLLYRHISNPKTATCAPAILSALHIVDVRKEAKEEAWRRRRHLCIDRVQSRAASASGRPWTKRAKREQEREEEEREKKTEVVEGKGAGGDAGAGKERDDRE
jgi:hypothetical protein